MKTKANHTPGTWTCPAETRMYFDDGRIIGAEGEVIAYVPCDDTIEVEDGAIVEVLSPKAQANRTLIAAVPELAGALNNLLGLFESLHANHAEWGDVQVARAALKKAGLL